MTSTSDYSPEELVARGQTAAQYELQKQQYEMKQREQWIVTPPDGVKVIPTSAMATASMVFGVISILGGFFLGLPTVLAIVFGHLAMRETKGGYRAGHGSTITGLILGYLSLVPLICMVIAFAFAGAAIFTIGGL